MNATGPAEHDVLSDEIEHFEQRLIVGKNGLAFGHLAQLPVIVFNHIRGVNQFAGFRRILEKGGDFAPVAPPGLNDQRILDAPYFLKIVQCGQGCLLGGRSVDRLEIRQQFFGILVGDIANGVANLMYHALLDFRVGITGFERV